MKKVLLFFFALLTGVSGAWADGLLPSTTESASAEYQYKIFCRGANTYYLGNTTNATNSGADYGLFAFFADDSGDYTNGYYIYSILAGKWVSYEVADSYSDESRGKDKVTMVSDKPSVPWYIAADGATGYYDVRAFQTDKSVDASGKASWNWHGGASNNTDHTMGYYDYTDGNSSWGFVLAGGSGYEELSVADRKVVALYTVPSDNNEYPLYNSNGTPKVSNGTSATPQYFILKQNGIDEHGEALYLIQKAESDGKYLQYNSFATSGYNYMFLNSSSYFYDQYTYGDGYTAASSSYYNLFRRWPNNSDNSSRPYSNQVAECNDAVVNMFSGKYNSLPAPVSAKGSGNWTGRWKVKEQSYTAWQVIITGAAGGSITYKGTSLLSSATTTQSNNGMFVINSASTPTSSDFTINNVDGYLTDPSISFDTNRKLIKVTYTEYATIYNTIKGFLDGTPEGIGYPTVATRATLQSAIDAFDASSKVTSDLVTLNIAYTAFQNTTNVNLPEIGKVYTIQNYVKSPSATTYLKNESGTLTIGASASETKLNNLWIVRKSGSNNVTLQSAADQTKFIVYNSFTLNATGAVWALSCGTEWPYISMFNASLGDSNGRYVACNGSNQFGTAGGSGYYGSDKTQASGWSTDFKFVESSDYALYKVKIIYPSGSSPTVTYSETAYSNGADFVAPTTLTANDLSVSEISGYTPTVTIDGDVVYVNYDMAVAAPYADTWDFDNSPWSLLTSVPSAIDNASRTYRYNTKRINIATTHSSSVEVVFAYSSGRFRIDVAGVDLIDPSTGNVVKGDYHDGYSGNAQSNREYAIRDVAPGNYILRYISFDQSTSSAGNISVRVVPSQGFYRLKNVATNKYLTAKATGAWNSSTRYVYANGNATDASTVIRLYEKDSDGKLYMYNQGYGFGWTATNHGGGVAWITGSPDKYVNWFPGTADDRVAFAICFGNGTGDYADYLEKGIYTVDTSDEAVIAGDDKTANAAQWVIEPATTVTIPLNHVASTNGSYATICFPFDVTLESPTPSSGAIPYVVNIVGSRAQLEAFGSLNIPTGTPVLLAGDYATESVTATITSGLLTFTGDNDLRGTYFDKTSLADNEYIFGTNNGELGFWKMNSGNKVGANKAYLVYSGIPSSVKGFAIDFDNVDGISSIDNGQLWMDNAPIYNLAGQRVAKAQKGLYIVNGKKVLVK